MNLKLLNAAVLGLLLVAVGGLAMSVWHYERQNEALVADNEALQREASDYDQKLHALREVHSLTQEELKQSRQRVQELSQKLDKADKEEPGGLLAKAVQPFQSRVYLGRQLLGTGWIVPGNVSTNAENGAVSMRPEVRLNENWKRYFTEYRTNVVERTVEDQRTQNYTQSYSYYYPQYPFFFGVGHRSPHVGIGIGNGDNGRPNGNRNGFPSNGGNGFPSNSNGREHARGNDRNLPIPNFANRPNNGGGGPWGAP